MASALHLLITEVPPGEAPQWVREKWVGLSIPLAQTTMSPQVFRTSSLFDMPGSFLGCLYAFFKGNLKRESGFLVESKVAIDLLSIKSPEAASWWHENTPRLMQSNQYFVFHECCGRAQVIQYAS